MANVLNFNNIKKQYLTITLPDEKNTVVMVCTPTKSLLEELVSVEQTFKDAKVSEKSIDQTLGDLYDLIARVMSRNKGGIKITKEQLEKCLDFEDIVVFFQSYLAFIQTLKNSKN